MTVIELKELLVGANDNDKLEIVDGKMILVRNTPAGCKFSGPASKDITKRIKTFEDAYEWCFYNNYYDLCHQYTSCNDILDSNDNCSDLRAYLKLRIITVALNEGQELVASKDSSENYWIPVLDRDEDTTARRVPGRFGDSAQKLGFKSREVAEYAGKQFKDIYAVFCGV